MDYTDRPLLKALQQFIEKQPVSFHVPGHKNGLLSRLPLELQAALRYDVTELTGLDDLHEPNGVIEEAQNKLAFLYGSTKSYFLVNGSTVGNLAMIYATCSRGDTVIVQRNAHKSIVNGLELTGANPVFITPPWDRETCAAGTVGAMQIDKALKQYPEAKAVILTYPTYYGAVGEGLKDIITRCHASGIPVLVDEAHGAHFVVGEPFPVSALDLGADIVVQSAHKTLPAMTMASFLHVKSDLIGHDKVAHYLQMLQSSSPSYVLMASLDDARAYVEAYDEKDIGYFMEERAKFIRSLRKVPRLQVIEADDPLKISLRVDGYSGFDIQRQLEEENVFVELADAYQVLLVLPLLQVGVESPFDMMSRTIGLGVNGLPDRTEIMTSIKIPPIEEEIKQLVHTSASLESMEKEWISYESAVGCIAAASVIPYPPGIPLLIAGERITAKQAKQLQSLVDMGAKFQGVIRVNEGQLLVVKPEMEE